MDGKLHGHYQSNHSVWFQVLTLIPCIMFCILIPSTAKEAYDYRSGGRGGNRFATILMYMSDIDEGGETVFSRAPLPGIENHNKAKRDTVQELRKAGEIPSEIKAGSWEEDMVGACRTSLNVVPKKSRAVLFYSQFPNGQEDPSSFHGACPVLRGTKWAANVSDSYHP